VTDLVAIKEFHYKFIQLGLSEVLRKIQRIVTKMNLHGVNASSIHEPRNALIAIDLSDDQIPGEGMSLGFCPNVQRRGGRTA